MLDMGAAVGAVDVTISRVTAIANAKLPGAEDDVTTHARAFRDMPVTVADFSQVPAAQELGEHHEAARQVFDETIQGVLSDLKEFRAALLECMKNHEATDDSVQTALLSLGSRYADHHYHSTRNNRESRIEQGSRLGDADQPLDGGTDGARPDAQPAQPDAQPGAQPGNQPGAEPGNQPGGQHGDTGTAPSRTL